MMSRIILPLAMAAAVAGCSFLPFNVSENEWDALTPQQKIDLRRQWYEVRVHPSAAILTPADTAPFAGKDAAKQSATLTQQNAALTEKLAETQKEILRLQEQVKKAAYILGNTEPPAPAAAPNPPVKADTSASSDDSSQ
ncbi:MAG: hypothetical protein M0006_10535 [Magnetospirillum sp.]|nr:hypothetical protein [Magnetospirillum sp.]